MELILIQFFMGLTVFGCCLGVNLLSTETIISVPTMVGTFASIGWMFYQMYLLGAML